MEKKINSWQEAIYRVSEPLLKEKIIEKSYVQAMIDNVLNYGDYMVIVPNVVMPHARPEDGVNKTGVSILKLEEPLLFGKSKYVSMLICLASVNSSSHLQLLQQISALIDEEEKVSALLAVSSKDEFINLAQKMIEQELF